MSVSESKENYLEIIYMLGIKNGQVRAIDIADYLGFTRASVSVALKNLRQENYIESNTGSLIKLTPKGKAVAISVYEKHEILSAWFVSMGVDEDTARNDACRIEHVISEKSFNAIKNFLKSK